MLKNFKKIVKPILWEKNITNTILGIVKVSNNLGCYQWVNRDTMESSIRFRTAYACKQNFEKHYISTILQLFDEKELNKILQRVYK